MNIYKEIEDSVSFEEFLIYSGYEYAHGRAKNCFYNKKNHEYIYLDYKAPLNKFVYYSLQKGDKGDLINFVRNRLNRYDLITRDKHDEKQAINILKAYIKLPLDEKIKKIKRNIPKLSPAKLFEEKLNSYKHFSNLYCLKPLYNTDILNFKGITNETLRSPTFKDSLFNCNAIKFNKDGSSTVYENLINLAFLYKDIEAREAGMQTYFIDKSKNVSKLFVKNSLRKAAVWITKHLSNKTKKLFITENPLNAISYHQLKELDESYRYMATGGQIAENQIAIISALVDKYRYHIELGNEYSIIGQRYNLDIICYLSYSYFSGVISSLYSSYLKLDLKFHPLEKIQDQIKIFLNGINKINKKVKNDFESDRSSQECFLIGKNGENSYTIQIPNRAFQLASFNDLLIKTLKLNITLRIPDSLDDWNKDLQLKKNIKSHAKFGKIKV